MTTPSTIYIYYKCVLRQWFLRFLFLSVYLKRFVTSSRFVWKRVAPKSATKGRCSGQSLGYDFDFRFTLDASRPDAECIQMSSATATRFATNIVVFHYIVSFFHSGLLSHRSLFILWFYKLVLYIYKYILTYHYTLVAMNYWMETIFWRHFCLM